MNQARGKFELTGWDEQPVDEAGDGSRITLAKVTQTFSGDIEGDGLAEWVMAYRPDGTAHFVGLQRVDGSIGGTSGRFVLETAGDFEDGVASWGASVVPRSGTDDLQQLSGTGRFRAPHGSTAEFELDYELT